MASTPTPDAGRRVVLDLHADVVELTRALCDLESVSGAEGAIADAVEAALRACDNLRVERDGDAVVAWTTNHPEGADRVVVAGHLDTVPLGRRPAGQPDEGAPTLPCWIAPAAHEGYTVGEEALWGRGTVDMKGGVAMALSSAAALAGPDATPNRAVTWVFYDHEEVEASLNGLGRIARNHPDWLAADFAVLGEPSNDTVEGGCNGTIRVEVTVPGVAAHSARAWKGDNAIHKAGEVIERLRSHTPREVEVDGLVYRESLGAVLIRGGVATNVVPDECVVTVNYRFAPSMSVGEAEAFLRELFDGFALEVTDVSGGARPGLDHPAAAAFVAAIGGEPTPKYGWTDVARFSELGVPAVNFGPGDPLLAHKDDEHCPTADLRSARDALLRWLSA